MSEFGSGPPGGRDADPRQQHFEDGLAKLAVSLAQPQGIKSYAKVREPLGRLGERYPTIAQFYEMKVAHHAGQASRLTWEIAQPEQRQNRLAWHLFITVLAYHLLATIQRRLRIKGLSYRWQSIGARWATQMWVTVARTNDQGERLASWQTTDPEPFHLEIFRALNLPPQPLKTKIVVA